MRSKKRTLITALIVLLILASAGLAAAMMIPSAGELLTQSLETLETITDGHAIIEVTAELPEENPSGTFEVWGKLNVGPDGEPAMRLEVLEASKSELAGLTAVSDGVQFWLYDPGRNTVVTGQREELAPILAEKMAEYQGEWPYSGEWAHPDEYDPADMPQTPAEAVAKLLEYVTAERDGQDEVAGDSAYRLRLVPIAEKMPDELRAAGGFVNLWLRTGDQLPVAAEYDESALVYAKAEATFVEINTDLDETIFTFDIPEGAEVIQATDLLADLEALELSTEAVDFEPLTPTYLPESATLEESQPVGGAVVQRYNLPDGLSFVIAQGSTLPLERPAEATSSETVTVRGVEGTLFSNDEGTRSLLAWQEGELFILVGGDVTPEQALAVAESLQ